MTLLEAKKKKIKKKKQATKQATQGHSHSVDSFTVSRGLRIVYTAGMGANFQQDCPEACF